MATPVQAGLTPAPQAETSEQAAASAAAAAASSAAANQQTLQGNVNQAAAASNTGNVYFGTTKQNPGGVGTPLLGLGGGTGSLGSIYSATPTPVYGVYDPAASFTLPGAPAGNTAGAPVFVSTTAATNMYYNWTQAQQNEFRAQYGMVDSTAYTATDAQMASAWAGLVNQAAAYQQAGKNVTPWDVLAKDISSNSGGVGKGNKTQTRDIQQVTLTSAPDSDAIFMSAAQSLLGRAPTANEQAAFHQNLNSVETANPTNSQTQYTYNPQGWIIDKNVLKSTGGVSSTGAENLAEQSIRSTPEYANYQAATTYMGALQSLLSGGTV